MRHYQDILNPRRRECSNFLWVSRTLVPQRAFAQNGKVTPQHHKNEVLKSVKIQELLTTLSTQQGVSVDVLEEKVRQILDEIGYNKKIKVIRWLGLMLVKICLRINTGIFVNEASLLQVKSAMGSCPVIFVPSHRSYADFILVSLLCFHEDIAIPAIAAGMDFHGMWGMGAILRDTGAFFMRRSYNDDSLYWTTFKQYIYQLVTKGSLPIEFFIEGTRSRSNKSLMPKYGLILMILKAFFLGQVPDILFVPINISYERILEERLFAFELLGIPKPKESTSGFFKSLSIIKEQFGSIFFDFAKPISAKAFFEPHLDRSSHNIGPIHQQEINESEKQLIPEFAHHIVEMQQKHCVITTFNLLAIILNWNLIGNKELLTMEELVDKSVWLKGALEELGAYVHMPEPHNDVLKALEVHKKLVQVDTEGKVTLIWDKIVLDDSNAKRLKGHSLSAETIAFSVPFVMLQMYINPVLHYLVDITVLVLSVVKCERLTEDGLFQHYHFLRSLLSQEFVSFSLREQTDFETARNVGLKLGVLRKDEGFYALGENGAFAALVIPSLDCFLYTYHIIIAVLIQNNANVIGEKDVLVQAQALIEDSINTKGTFVHPYSLSLDTMANCLSILSTRNILHKRRNQTEVTYEISQNEVFLLLSQLEIYVPLVEQAQSVHLQLQNKL